MTTNPEIPPMKSDHPDPERQIPIGDSAGGAGGVGGDEQAQIKKGAYFSIQAVVYVEGEDAPAHDFAKDARAVVREVLASGKSKKHPHWRVELKKVEETEMPGEWD